MATPPFRVLYTDHGFSDVATERALIEEAGGDLVVAQCRTAEDVIEAAEGADALLVQWAPITADVIATLDRCKVLVRLGIGVDNVDLAAARAHGVPVCNVPDYCIDEVADHTLALILAATRQIGPCDSAIKAGQWKLPVALTALHALKYMTIGLVAFGRIGREVAARLNAFKCKVLVFDPALPESVIRDAGCVPATLDDVLTQSDLITLHCPSTEKTRRMINADSIAKMKKGVILVNASRGTLVDTGALAAALQSGQISAAALDVADPEPLNADSPLLKMSNVVITPHVASATPQAVQKLRTDAAGIAAMALRGEKVPNVVNGVRQD